MPSWLGLTVLLVERNTSIAMSQRSRARNPSMRNPASKEMISDSVELCETELCFLHIQLIGTTFLIPKLNKTPLRLILGLQGPQQSLSLGINTICIAEPCFPHSNIVGIRLCDECKTLILPKRRSHASVHLVTNRARFLTDRGGVKSSYSCQVQALQDNL